MEGQKRNYELHHDVRNLVELVPHQNIWISGTRLTGKNAIPKIISRLIRQTYL